MNNDDLDPIYVSGIRELKWILGAWLTSCLWVVGYCALFGYEVSPEQMTIVWGMPSWVFWGVLVPWIVSTLFTAWFVLFKMHDQPLPDVETKTTDTMDMSGDRGETDEDRA